MITVSKEATASPLANAESHAGQPESGDNPEIRQWQLQKREYRLKK